MGLFNRKTPAENTGASNRELLARHLQATGQRLASERGGQIANRVSQALGCGSISYCDNPTCPNCAPTQ